MEMAEEKTGKGKKIKKKYRNDPFIFGSFEEPKFGGDLEGKMGEEKGEIPQQQIPF